MLTRRGGFVALAGSTLLASGFAFVNYYFILIGTFLIFALVFSLPLFALTAHVSGIEIDRILDKNKVFAGDFIHVKVIVKNKSHRMFDFIEIYDAYPEVWVLAIGDNGIATRLEPGKESSFSYILQCRVRGTYKIGPTTIILKDRMGFHYYKREIREHTEVLVYPTYKDVRKMQALGPKRQLGMLFGAHRTRVVGMGNDFYGFKLYTVGDPFRLIDWKVSAKRGKAYVKQFESEKNIRVVIFVDSSGSMGNGYPENTKLEYSIRAAVLLSHFAIERRDPVGVVVFSDKVHQWVPPSYVRDHIYKILDALAMAQASGGSNYVEAVDYVNKKLTKRAFFMFLTDLEESTSDIAEAIKKAIAFGHHAIVISPFGPWFEVPFGEFDPVDKALAEAVSEELYQRRLEISRVLSNFGVSTINVGPEDFLPTVLKEFLKAKQRGVVM